MQEKPRFPVLVWVGFGLLLLLVYAFHVFPLTDTDIWWHLASGRWMLEQRAIPRMDPFCLSSLGHPWVDAQWGFQLIAIALWKAGGSAALVQAKALAAAGIFAFILFRAWNRNTMPFLFAFATYAAWHGRFLSDVRPIWATLFLLALQYRLLRDALDGKRALPWLLLPLSQCLMVQMQGLHWLGPLQAGLLAIGHFGWDWKSKLARRTGWMLGLLTLCGLVNPYGWRGWIFPATLFQRIIPGGGNVFSEGISENIPFWKWMVESPGAAYPFLILGILVAAMGYSVRSRMARGEFLILIAFTVLGLMAQRNLPLFLFACLLTMARILPEWVGQDPRGRPLLRLAVLFCWAWCLAQTGVFAWKLHSARRWEIAGSWETPFRFPQGAVRYIRSHALHGGVFNEMRHGGYLGWHLFPDHHPFLDGRMVLHDAGFFRKFLGIFDHPETFEAYRKKFGLTWVVLPLTEGVRPWNLVVHLATTKAMTPVFCDGAEIILTAPEAWAAWERPVPWTLAQGDSAAFSRFGKNPRLLEKARQNLDRWNSLSEVH